MNKPRIIQWFDALPTTPILLAGILSVGALLLFLMYAQPRFVGLPATKDVKYVTELAPAAPIPVSDLKCPPGWTQNNMTGGTTTQSGVGNIACDRVVRGESWSITLNADAQRSRVLVRYKPLPPVSTTLPDEVDAKLTELGR